MKISKLFHWLYALVMLLPIFAIGSTCLISTFNMAAKDESEVHYKYQTNEVNSNDDLVNGNIYKLNQFSVLQDSDFQVKIIEGTFQFSSVSSDDVYLDEYFLPVRLNNSYLISFSTDYLFIYLSDSDSDYISIGVDRIMDFSCDDLYIQLIYFNDEYNDSARYLDFSISDYNVIQSVETHNFNTQDIFYNAIDKVKQSPLFSWAYDSFLVAPFSYIVSLFSMPANSFVVQMLSYWLAISIIWLVFDLVMYVPLLVHRWLDKGVLE